MLRFLAPVLAIALTLAGALVLARPALLAERTEGELIAVLAPDAVTAGERFVVFAGVRSDGPARLWVRVCTSATRCQLERSEPFPAGTTFKWVASPTLASGDYLFEAFLQVPTLLGYRSVDRFSGHVTAR